MENNVLQAINKSLELLTNMVKDLDARMNALEDRVAKSTSEPVAKASEDDKGPIVVRYSRYTDWLNGVNSRGGVTYVFKLNYNNRTAKVGIAVCSLKDNFNKATGRKLAEDRLKNDPMVFSFDPHSKIGLVKAFWRAVNLGEVRMSKDNRRIIKNIRTDKFCSNAYI